MRKKDRIGKLPPRYAFILNQHRKLRVSKCPLCSRLTYARKFVLLVHISDWGPLVLHKTCRYCSRCELIVAHEDELDAELDAILEQLAPGTELGDYVVLGTMDRKIWQQGVSGAVMSVGDSLAHVADFKRVLDLRIERG